MPLNHVAKTVTRRQLDEIRELIMPGWHGRGRPCLVCGFHHQRVHQSDCPVCQGQTVRAQNALRAIQEIAKVLR
jgi:predicted Zn-ribbon and HTH transcriptional regulator